jgi:DMSO/TMAO reductase YedYZ molybdopterin-dependent catalytic subunit
MPLGRFDSRPTPPLNTLLGTGLDARQFTDLSGLDSDHPRTATEQFYIRTAHPPSLPPVESWRIACGGLVADERLFDIRSMETDAHDIGLRTMECAGNSDPANFGLLSAAEWSGVPISAVLDRVRPLPAARRVRITGVDDEQRPSVTSNPGASWVFTREELDRTGAFLALRMNGAPLTADHGAPIRLVVPNYYGCSCIKWVSRIDWVADDEPATSQMMEFSARTHQNGVPRIARDYQPPVIDLAALPIRVEQWVVTQDARERAMYRIVGARWGGTVRHAPLTIRFRLTERFVPVDDSPPTNTPAAWSLWSHQWTPDAPGRYQITLGVSDPTIRTRRLDLYYYTREVEIDRV